MFIKLVRFSSRIISLFPKNTPAFYFSSSARDKTNNLVLGQYSEEQQEHVLNVLNTFSNSTPQIKIGAKQLKSIQSFLKDNKEFQNLNQVLDLNGIGPYTLKNLCNGILIQDKGSNGNKKAAPKVKSGILIPPLHEAQKQQIKSITGIQIGYFYISWARFDLATNTVTDWMQTNFNNVTDLKSLHNLYEFVVLTKKSIPESDIYLMENTNWSILSAQTSLFQHVRAAHTTAVFLALLNSDRSDDRNLSDISSYSTRNRVYFLRSFLPTRYFKTLIGTERVSPQKMVEEMFDGNFPEYCMTFYIKESCRDNYFIQDKPMRECLCQSLLLTVTFIEVIINNKIYMKSNSNKK
ncbi:transcription elongation factor, mitochondrial isoform X1 [Lycorma delicatula]|uniref:transcription elongation factor, mitochondrial isoform X1 n=1 Tax=Lycorma delicatula TaxID=130591 RepID=UPI003F515206